MSVNIPSSRFSFVDLDFDGIMGSLTTYLQSQEEFSDYNFAGSGLRALLNILCYNTQYLGIYCNFIANEMYLDSAQRRESIVSLAKQLGYTPTSRVSAQAIVNIKIIPPSSPTPPAFITIDKFTPFNASVNNVVYTFVNLQAITIAYDSGNQWYLASNVTLNEGAPYTFKYTVDTSVTQQYLIPNSGVDMNTVIVAVQQNPLSSVLTTYIPNSNIDLIDGNTTVYFTQEVQGELYEIYFGDGILGTQLIDGNVIFISYLNCNADAPNFANVFSAAALIGGYGNILVTTVNSAAGGAEREDIESVRFQAPRNYQTQGRAVTAQDYKTIVTTNYLNVDSVAVFGGENQSPPQYGKVFLSLKPKTGYFITENTKQGIVADILQRRNIVSIIPVIIDPEYIYVLVNSLVKYNAQSTTLTAADIQNLVITTIQNFATNNIGKFDSVLQYSTLTRLIDASEPSITNDLTTLQMQKWFTPTVGVINTYVLNFQNNIVPGTLTSTAFIDTLDPSYAVGQQYFFDDDGNGTIRTYKFIGTVKTYTKLNVGTISYSDGTVTLINFIPQSVVDSTGIIKVTVIPLNNDIIPLLNTIVIIQDSDITVSMQINPPIY